MKSQPFRTGSSASSATLHHSLLPGFHAAASALPTPATPRGLLLLAVFAAWVPSLPHHTARPALQQKGHPRIFPTGFSLDDLDTSNPAHHASPFLHRDGLPHFFGLHGPISDSCLGFLPCAQC
ncbi:hypothetical protein S245_005493 [Arachis hypogaea]